MGNDFSEWWDKIRFGVDIPSQMAGTAEYLARMAWNAAISSVMEGGPEPKCDNVGCNCPDCWRNKE